MVLKHTILQLQQMVAPLALTQMDLLNLVEQLATGQVGLVGVLVVYLLADKQEVKLDLAPV
jgi:hypothetical protein